MTTKKIPFNYDINRMLAVDLIAIIHIDDYDTRFLELTLFDDGTPFSVEGCIVTSRFVTISGSYLLSDNVPCEATGNTITIPIDAAAVQMMACDIKIEVNIVDGEKILTLPFPLWVRVRGSILETAHVTPESQGTIPELLKEAAEELERVKGFVTSDDVYNILDQTLQGAQNVAPSLYVKQKGDNYALVYEDSDDVLHELFDFSNLPSGGVTSYNDLTDKPTVTIDSQANTLSGALVFDNFEFKRTMFGSNGVALSDAVFVSAFDIGFATPYDFAQLSKNYIRTGCFYELKNRAQNIPVEFSDATNGFYIFNFGERYVPYEKFVRIVTYSTTSEIKTFIQFYSVDYNYEVTNASVWQQIGGGSQIVSGVVNQNGTITFTDSDGNTFTTTGESAIGADGFSPIATVQQTASGATVSITDKNGTTTANISNGADGQDYVLTSQDKTDIANIVLGELPTTQGVLYGNTSN